MQENIPLVTADGSVIPVVHQPETVSAKRGNEPSTQTAPAAIDVTRGRQKWIFDFIYIFEKFLDGLILQVMLKVITLACDESQKVKPGFQEDNIFGPNLAKFEVFR